MNRSQLFLLSFAVVLATLAVAMIKNGQPTAFVMGSVAFIAACFGGAMRLFRSHG